MAVILELRCAAHGEFESTKKKCPWGCPQEFVSQEFRTPVSIKSAGTKVVDHHLRGFQKDFNLPDIKNDKDGSSVMQSIRKGQVKEYRPTSMAVPHLKPGWTQRGEKPSAYGGVYGMGENAIQNYRNHAAPRLGNLGPPKPKFVNQPNKHDFSA